MMPTSAEHDNMIFPSVSSEAISIRRAHEVQGKGTHFGRTYCGRIETAIAVPTQLIEVIR